MKTPKFTDQSRFADAPYTRASETDITQCWERARQKLEQEQRDRAERLNKVREIGTRKL